MVVQALSSRSQATLDGGTMHTDRGQVTVEAIWKTQVHTYRITSLSLSSDQGYLYCGSEAGLPREDGAVVARVEAEGGQVVDLYSSDSPLGAARLVLAAGEVCACITACGSVAVWTRDGQLSLEEGVLAEGGPGQAGGAAVTVPSQQFSPAREPGNSAPDFLPEAGYRGHREGYLFRQGDSGSGYYRKEALARGILSGQASKPSLQHVSHAQAKGLYAAVTSPDGTLLATGSMGPQDCAARVWSLGLQPGAPAALQQTLEGHAAAVLAVAFTPCGSLLFTGSYDKTIRAWQAPDWTCVRVLKGHGGGIRALAVSSDGQTLYSAAADNTIRVWSVGRWVCLRALSGRHEDTTWPCCAALSPDGGVLVSGSTGPFGGSTLKAFRTAAGKDAGSCLATFAQLGPDEKGDVSALLFSADGSVLYSGASDGSVAAWQLSQRASNGRPSGLRRGFL